MEIAEKISKFQTQKMNLFFNIVIIDYIFKRDPIMKTVNK